MATVEPKIHLHRWRPGGGAYAWSACGIQFIRRESEARFVEILNRRVTCERCRAAVARELVAARRAGWQGPPTRIEARVLAEAERRQAARRWLKKVADHREWKRKYREARKERQP